MTNAHQIEQSFVVINPRQKASIERVDAALYQRLDSNYADFKGHQLIACYSFEDDWQSWECHPHGDEVVLLLSGTLTLILKTEQGEEHTTLSQPGQYVLVPKGVWHTAKTSSSKVLFITPGEATEHQPL